MKILMAARWPVGGIRTFLSYVYSQREFEDCRIFLISPGADLAEYLRASIPERRFITTACEASIQGFAFSVRKALKQNHYDILHTHGVTSAMIGQAARVGLDIRHLTTVHDMFLPTTFSGPFGRIKQGVMNLELRGIDAVHAVSADCAENFREYMPMVPTNKVHPILHGIDTQRFANAKPVDIHSKFNLPRDTRLIGFFGRFMAPKGFRTLIDGVRLIAGKSTLR